MGHTAKMAFLPLVCLLYYMPKWCVFKKVVRISCAIAPVHTLQVPLLAEKQTSSEWAWLYEGSAKDIRWRRCGRRHGRDSLNALDMGDAVRSSMLPLVSSALAKNELSHYAPTAQLISVVRQYIKTTQQCVARLQSIQRVARVACVTWYL